MFSRSKSSLTFSPRMKHVPQLLRWKIDDTIAFSIASRRQHSSQDRYRYIITSNGIEICPPQEVGHDNFLTEIASEDGSLSSADSPSYQGSDQSVRDVSEYWDTVKADECDIIVSSVRQLPLSQRRGRSITPLDAALWAEAKRSSDSPSFRENWPNPDIPKDCRFLRTIGEGGEGHCDLVMRESDGKLQVIKTVKRPLRYGNRPMEAVILQGILADFHHNNIIHFHGFETFNYGSSVQYRLEYAAGGDLHDLASRYMAHNTFLPELFIWKTFSQLASALEFLHRGFDRHCKDSNRHGIVHRDIKPENIFLRSSTNGRAYPDLVLADFGCATLEFATYDRKGTYLWQGPEFPRQSPKGDVYSLGAIIHYLIHFESPLTEMPPGMQPTITNLELWEVSPEARRPRTDVPDFYDHDICDFMLKATNLNPMKRIDSSKLVTELDRHCNGSFLIFEGPGDMSHKSPLADWALSDRFQGCTRDRRLTADSPGSTVQKEGEAQYIEVMNQWFAEKRAEGSEAVS